MVGSTQRDRNGVREGGGEKGREKKTKKGKEAADREGGHGKNRTGLRKWCATSR